MDREARRGRLRRWGAILAALIRAGGAWIRRALLRHHLARRTATAIFTKEHRKGADAFCSKNHRSPPRQNRRSSPQQNRERTSEIGDIGNHGELTSKVGDIGAAQGLKKSVPQENTAATTRAAAVAHSEELARVAPGVKDSVTPPQARRAEGPRRQKDAATVIRSDALVASKKPEPLTCLGPAAPSTEAAQGAKEGRRLQPAQRAKTARKAKADARSVSGAKTSKSASVPGAQKAELFEEGYFIDTLFAEEAGDPEIMAHSSYGRDNRRYKGYTLCLICHLKGKLTKIRDQEEMKKHCRSAHKCDGIKCEKQGCIARGINKNQIGLHQVVCHKI